MSVFAEGIAFGHPYWWEDVTWPELPTEMPTAVDLLVIGAGYTGLSAAVTACEKGANVAVIDAGQPGQGASTRNGGMIGAHPRLSWDALAHTYSPDLADRLFTEAGVALDWVKSLIRSEGFDSDYQETGRIQLAYAGSHFESQKILADNLRQKGGVECYTCQRDQLSTEINTPLYKGGLVFPNHGAVHPAKYYLSFLNRALRRGIPVLANTPATQYKRTSTGFDVTTPRGKIHAHKVVLATNGYTGGPFSWFARRVFPVPSFLIATEPLSPNLIGDLAPGRRMMVETRARHSYFRVSPDGTRIVFGGRAALVGIDVQTAAKRLFDTMVEIWPELATTKITHAWTGNTGYSFAHIPHVGHQDGLHYALAYCGGGTVLAPYLGHKAALQALGDPDGETPYSETQFKARWFHPVSRPHFMNAADLWYRSWVDSRDRRAAGM